MWLGRVVGDIVATEKNKHFKGAKLMMVRPIELKTLRMYGSSTIAIDRVDAGPGEIVLVMDEGNSVRQLMKADRIPSRTL
ncbi:MAG: ethanolamine utilization protein EutN, partial [Candidatus Coatesbacteria bacterium]